MKSLDFYKKLRLLFATTCLVKNIYTYICIYQFYKSR